MSKNSKSPIPEDKMLAYLYDDVDETDIFGFGTDEDQQGTKNDQTEVEPKLDIKSTEILNENESLKETVKKLQNEKEILELRISEIYQTAKRELERKERRVQELQEECNNMVFRRSRKTQFSHYNNKKDPKHEKFVTQQAKVISECSKETTKNVKEIKHEKFDTNNEEFQTIWPVKNEAEPFKTVPVEKSATKQAKVIPESSKENTKNVKVIKHDKFDTNNEEFQKIWTIKNEAEPSKTIPVNDDTKKADKHLKTEAEDPKIISIIINEDTVNKQQSNKIASQRDTNQKLSNIDYRNECTKLENSTKNIGASKPLKTLTNKDFQQFNIGYKIPKKNPETELEQKLTTKRLTPPASPTRQKTIVPENPNKKQQHSTPSSQDKNTKSPQRQKSISTESDPHKTSSRSPPRSKTTVSEIKNYQDKSKEYSRRCQDDIRVRGHPKTPPGSPQRHLSSRKKSVCTESKASSKSPPRSRTNTDCKNCQESSISSRNCRDHMRSRGLPKTPPGSPQRRKSIATERKTTSKSPPRSRTNIDNYQDKNRERLKRGQNEKRSKRYPESPPRQIVESKMSRNRPKTPPGSPPRYRSRSTSTDNRREEKRKSKRRSRSLSKDNAPRRRGVDLRHLGSPSRSRRSSPRRNNSRSRRSVSRDRDNRGRSRSRPRWQRDRSRHNYGDRDNRSSFLKRRQRCRDYKIKDMSQLRNRLSKHSVKRHSELFPSDHSDVENFRLHLSGASDEVSSLDEGKTDDLAFNWLKDHPDVLKMTDDEIQRLIEEKNKELTEGKFSEDEEFIEIDDKELIGEEKETNKKETYQTLLEETEKIRNQCLKDLKDIKKSELISNMEMKLLETIKSPETNDPRENCPEKKRICLEAYKKRKMNEIEPAMELQVVKFEEKHNEIQINVVEKIEDCDYKYLPVVASDDNENDAKKLNISIDKSPENSFYDDFNMSDDEDRFKQNSCVEKNSLDHEGKCHDTSFVEKINSGLQNDINVCDEKNSDATDDCCVVTNSSGLLIESRSREEKNNLKGEEADGVEKNSLDVIVEDDVQKANKINSFCIEKNTLDEKSYGSCVEDNKVPMNEDMKNDVKALSDNEDELPKKNNSKIKILCDIVIKSSPKSASKSTKKQKTFECIEQIKKAVLNDDFVEKPVSTPNKVSGTTLSTKELKQSLEEEIGISNSNKNDEKLQKTNPNNNDELFNQLFGEMSPSPCKVPKNVKNNSTQVQKVKKQLELDTKPLRTRRCKKVEPKKLLMQDIVDDDEKIEIKSTITKPEDLQHNNPHFLPNLPCASNKVFDSPNTYIMKKIEEKKKTKAQKPEIKRKTGFRINLRPNNKKKKKQITDDEDDESFGFSSDSDFKPPESKKTKKSRKNNSIEETIQEVIKNSTRDSVIEKSPHKMKTRKTKTKEQCNENNEKLKSVKECNGKAEELKQENNNIENNEQQIPTKRRIKPVKIGEINNKRNLETNENPRPQKQIKLETKLEKANQSPLPQMEHMLKQFENKSSGIIINNSCDHDGTFFKKIHINNDQEGVVEINLDTKDMDMLEDFEQYMLENNTSTNFDVSGRKKREVNFYTFHLNTSTPIRKPEKNLVELKEDKVAAVEAKENDNLSVIVSKKDTTAVAGTKEDDKTVSEGVKENEITALATNTSGNDTSKEYLNVPLKRDRRKKVRMVIIDLPG